MRLGPAAARTGVRALPAHGGRAGSPLHAVPRNDLGRSESVWLMFHELQNSSWKGLPDQEKKNPA